MNFNIEKSATALGKYEVEVFSPYSYSFKMWFNLLSSGLLKTDKKCACIVFFTRLRFSVAINSINEIIPCLLNKSETIFLYPNKLIASRWTPSGKTKANLAKVHIN